MATPYISYGLVCPYLENPADFPKSVFIWRGSCRHTPHLIYINVGNKLKKIANTKLRDKNRIPKILNELERIWKANPDFRLGQLIVVGTKPKEPCAEVFNLEDEKLLQGLLNFENRADLKTQEPKTISDWEKYPNISKIDHKEISTELLSELINELKKSDKKIVITPINLMKLNGAPVSDQTWLLSQKPRIKVLKKLLTEFEESGILTQRKSKQGFLGIKEIGYDIAE